MFHPVIAECTGQTFLEFAAQEMQHRERLEAIKAGKLPELDQARVETLGLSEHLVDVPVEKDMDYQSALLFAMKAEQRAYDLYAGLAKATDDPNLVTLFEGLAQEELKHKLHFEREYDDVVLGDN